MQIEWALNSRDRYGNPISLNGAAEKLNEHQLPSPRGGQRSWRTVRDLAFRLGFPARSAYVSSQELQARVDSAFRQHPG